MDNKKIDIVFTYVNGFDKKHIEKRSKFIKNTNKYNPNIRFESIDEIKYSVRSVIQNIKWINKIYIVTDEQIPPVDKNLILSGKVKIIDHKDIIPKKYLPTFFSDVIESYLHNIPNLSEIFIYNNDDYFNFNKVYKKDIICKNKIIFNGNIFDDKIHCLLNYLNLIFTEYRIRIYKTSVLLKEKFGINKFLNAHSSFVFRKSTLKNIEKNFSNELILLRKNKFRNITSINYIFLAINYENYINNMHFVNLNYHNSCIIKQNWMFNIIYFLIKYNIVNISFLKKKFVCINNIDIKNKNKFLKLMDMIFN